MDMYALSIYVLICRYWYRRKEVSFVILIHTIFTFIRYIYVQIVCMNSGGRLIKLFLNLCIYNSISFVIIKRGKIVGPMVQSLVFWWFITHAIKEVTILKCLQSLQVIQDHNLELNLNKCILEYLNLKIKTQEFKFKWRAQYFISLE